MIYDFGTQSLKVFYDGVLITTCGVNSNVCGDFKYCIKDFSLESYVTGSIWSGQQFVIQIHKERYSAIPLGCNYSLNADISLRCGDTLHPTSSPTTDPTTVPTIEPTLNPSMPPTRSPSIEPTVYPTVEPTNDPITSPPTGSATVKPTGKTNEGNHCICTYCHLFILCLMMIR